MSDRPNIVYILGDDQRADLLGSAGHPVLRTPNLDRLAAEGTRFTNTFCTSPLCTPSRACHYLGQWERTHGIQFYNGWAVAPSAWEQSFPMLLKAQGYYTGWVGKNHVPVGEGGYSSGYLESSFDYWYGNHGHTGFYPKEGGKDREIYRNAGPDTQPEVFWEGARAFLDPDRAFLSSCARPLPRRPDDRPFCLCVTFNLPHCASTGTMQLRPSDDDIYRSLYRDVQGELRPPRTWKGWDSHPPKLPREVWNGLYLPSYDWVKTPHALRERQIRMCQTIAGMDRFVGRVRELLERLNLHRNTVIVFSTDHGIHFGEHGIGGKVFMYEEDLRIPLIVYDPRIERSGQVRGETVVVPDLAPTVLDLCGLKPGARMQGRSMVPILNGKTVADWRQDFFAENLFDHQNYPRCECVRNRDWKYIRYFRRHEDPAQSGRFIRSTLDRYADTRLSSLREERPVYEELYNLADDLGEERNVVGDAGSAGILEAMRQRIRALALEALGDAEQPDVVDAGKTGV